MAQIVPWILKWNPYPSYFWFSSTSAPHPFDPPSNTPWSHSLHDVGVGLPPWHGVGSCNPHGFVVAPPAHHYADVGLQYLPYHPMGPCNYSEFDVALALPPHLPIDPLLHLWFFVHASSYPKYVVKASNTPEHGVVAWAHIFFVDLLLIRPNTNPSFATWISWLRS